MISQVRVMLPLSVKKQDADGGGRGAEKKEMFSTEKSNI